MTIQTDAAFMAKPIGTVARTGAQAETDLSLSRFPGGRQTHPVKVGLFAGAMIVGTWILGTGVGHFIKVILE